MKYLSDRVVSIVLALVIVFGVQALQAQQAPAAADVTGKWIFQVETSAGGGTPVFTFKQEGEKLTGHYSGQLGEAELTGSVKGQSIDFKFKVEVQGFIVESTYTGRIEGKDSMKGTVTLAGLGEGTFTGKRN